MKKLCFAALIAAVVFSCWSCSKSKATLSGRVVGADSVALYLERVLPGNLQVVDTTVTDNKGYFKFKVQLPNGQATIFNLRGGGDAIPLIISPRERVKVYSIGSLAGNYTVDGSSESVLMLELRKILSNGSSTLDSILNVYGFTFDEQKKKEVGTEYTSAYYKTKRQHIEFIIKNKGSLASLYALYQRLPNDYALFNGETDVIYLRQVADSVSVSYPESPYVKALNKEIATSEANDNAARMLTEKLAEGAVGYPDLEMADMYGKKHRLADLTGKVILVDFWAASSPESSLNNAELKEIYYEFNERGFEIYQVSLDELATKPLWVSAVQQQRLPWISVCDFKGAASFAARSYNVSSIPANFIIDRNGDISGKNIPLDKLRAQISKLL